MRTDSFSKEKHLPVRRFIADESKVATGLYGPCAIADDLDNIFNGETALFKLKQSCYDYLKENYHSLMKNGVKEADAKEQAIAKHFEDIPAGGFNFNF